jgi:competence protein ComEA
MKKAGTEHGQTRLNAGRKDKQTLVLFLLGCGILGMPLLAWQSPPSIPIYVVEQQAGAEDRWRVASYPAATRGVAAGKAQAGCQQDALSSHCYGISKNISFPAELAPFFHRPLPLNKSRQEDLEMLPGIGPHHAALLIAELQKKGRLSGPEDLLAVPGIGPATLRRLLPLVSFE